MTIVESRNIREKNQTRENRYYFYCMDLKELRTSLFYAYIKKKIKTGE